MGAMFQVELSTFQIAESYFSCLLSIALILGSLPVAWFLGDRQNPSSGPPHKPPAEN